jgi:Ca-activated chloride channel family protein
MNFLNSPALILLLILPVAVVLFIWRARERQRLISAIASHELLRALTGSINSARRAVKSGLWLLTAGALIMALARPAWGVEIDTVETQGVSVMIVLDVSASMDAQDLIPSRLERAKLELRQLFDLLAGNEMGLVLFAGTAFVQFPLTTDVTPVGTFLSAATTHSITQQGTDLAAAIRVAMNSFDAASGAQRYIVVASDGENLEGDPLRAAEEAVEQGIVIYTLGFGGTEGAPIPVRDTNDNIVTYKADRSGNLVFSTLNETGLRVIAERTGGFYQRAGGTDEINQLADAINQTGASSLTSRTQPRTVERFSLFVALAVLALSLEMLLPEMRREAA